MGDGRVASASRRDYAEAAAAAALDESTAGRTFELSGDQAWSFDEFAEALTVVTGRPVRYESLTPEQHAERLRGLGLDEGTVGFVVARLVRRGELGIEEWPALAEEDRLPREGQPVAVEADPQRHLRAGAAEPADDRVEPQLPLIVVVGRTEVGPHLMVRVEGEQHRLQRKMLNPAFNINHMREMIPIFYEVTHKVTFAPDND